jgi:hypothetical protein
VSDSKSNKQGALRELDSPSMCDLSFPRHPSLFQWRYLHEPYHLFMNGLIASCAMLLLVVQLTVAAIFPGAEAFRCNRLPFRTHDLSDLIKLATLGGSSAGYLGRVSCLMGSGNKSWVIRLLSLLVERLERLEMPRENVPRDCRSSKHLIKLAIRGLQKQTRSTCKRDKVVVP